MGRRKTYSSHGKKGKYRNGAKLIFFDLFRNH